MSWRGIAAFRLVTFDLDRLNAFYVSLGFEATERVPISAKEVALLGLSGAGTRQRLRLGPSRLDLDCFERAGRPYPDAADAASLCFQHLALVSDDCARDWGRLVRAEVTSISRKGPVTLPASAGRVTAVKFRDPDGHPLELLQFPQGAAGVWSGQGVLGIDHSAISVADAGASRRFYEDQGLTPGKASLNHVPTQVALDGLDDVEVEVVPLRPVSEPPHLELLGYRVPRGRPCGPRSPNDIAATRIVWHASVDRLVSDPDGHLHQLEAGWSRPQAKMHR